MVSGATEATPDSTFSIAPAGAAEEGPRPFLAGPPTHRSSAGDPCSIQAVVPALQGRIQSPSRQRPSTAGRRWPGEQRPAHLQVDRSYPRRRSPGRARPPPAACARSAAGRAPRGAAASRAVLLALPGPAAVRRGRGGRARELLTPRRTADRQRTSSRVVVPVTVFSAGLTHIRTPGASPVLGPEIIC